MASNKTFRFGPVALGTSIANILNPPGTTGGVGAGSPGTYIIIKHLTVVNKSGSAATFSFYLGATGGSAAGTEQIGTAKSVPANDNYQWGGLLRLDVADFFTGLASAVASLTVTGEGEIGIA